MSHDHLTQHADKMLGYLRKTFPRLNDDDRQDAVQTVLAEVIAKGADFEPDAEWSTYLCRAAFYAARAIWKKTERRWFESLAAEAAAGWRDPSAVPPVDAEVRAEEVESAIKGEVRRRGRQQLLLSDIFEEYKQRCETKGMQTQREIYERRLRGQDSKLILTSMGVTRDNYDKHVERVRKWISDRMQQSDVDRSVFQTFLRPTRDIPQLPPSVPADVPRNFAEVVLRVLNEAGALCPSDERLARYEQQPQAVEFSDLRYHLEEVPCELCRARRSLK